MKKITALIILFVITVTGCAEKSVSDAGDGRLKVCTSFYAIYDLVKSVGGDKIYIQNIVPTGTEPHDWEPSVHDMAKFESCDILFYNGCGMESWIDKAQASVDSGKTAFVCLSDGIANENAEDPHIWLSPANTEKMAEKIMNQLCTADSENAEYYRQSFDSYSSRLKALDQKYRDEISKFKNKNIVVSHKAYSYMCSEYGLNQVAVDGINADSEPSPDKMKEIIGFINDNNVKYIFYEELLSKKTVEILSEETGAQLLPLNPFEGLTDDEIAAGENYLTVMNKNLESLTTALGE